MGEEGKLDGPVTINTALGFKEDTNVNAHMAEVRENIQSRFQRSFESLPELKTTFFPIEKYVKENPQSVTFVPQKDLNMFPILIEEAKAFADKFDTGEKLRQIRDHEFEHVQKAYELGVDINGIGFFMFKHKGKPAFGGFVTSPKDQEISLREKLRIMLAPKIYSLHSPHDVLESEMLIINALVNSKTPEEFEKVISDTLFVVSERYLPKKIHRFLQK